MALGAGVAGAQPREEKALTAAVAPGVTVDWTRGALLARGVAAADRHAPSPAVARVAAERRAVDRARARLAVAVDRVPGAAAAASGGTVAADVRAAIARELERAPVIVRDFRPDGSVLVEVGLGLEALRQVTAGPRVLVAGADEGAASLVVADGRAAGVQPALGLALDLGGAPWRGAIVFAAAPPAGQGAPLAITRTAAGGLAADGARPAAGARVVVVVTP
jgi:hypothetical protein